MAGLNVKNREHIFNPPPPPLIAEGGGVREIKLHCFFLILRKWHRLLLKQHETLQVEPRTEENHLCSLNLVLAKAPPIPFVLVQKIPLREVTSYICHLLGNVHERIVLFSSWRKDMFIKFKTNKNCCQLSRLI